MTSAKGGDPKSRCSEGGCMNLVLQIKKCRHRSNGEKSITRRSRRWIEAPLLRPSMMPLMLTTIKLPDLFYALCPISVFSSFRDEIENRSHIFLGVRRLCNVRQIIYSVPVSLDRIYVILFQVRNPHIMFSCIFATYYRSVLSSSENTE